MQEVVSGVGTDGMVMSKASILGMEVPDYVPIVAVVGIIGVSLYIQATQCWFKKTGDMPGYCLMIFGRR